MDVRPRQVVQNTPLWAIRAGEAGDFTSRRVSAGDHGRLRRGHLQEEVVLEELDGEVRGPSSHVLCEAQRSVGRLQGEIVHIKGDLQGRPIPLGLQHDHEIKEKEPEFRSRRPRASGDSPGGHHQPGEKPADPDRTVLNCDLKHIVDSP